MALLVPVDTLSLATAAGIPSRLASGKRPFLRIIRNNAAVSTAFFRQAHDRPKAMNFPVFLRRIFL
jgi:hypothetical protein